MQTFRASGFGILGLKSFVFLLVSAGATGESLCPEPEAISPCECLSDIGVDCSGASNSKEIFSAFNKVVWPDTQQT
ncbi:unnamed protein product [Darwinula stevensoni]|uniref:Uncharacterized protein n=1 Tax=Darwinula stevensoni TaxID=69355 RepID=A0A7R8XBW8_9CRUS|nr:unnamed protein product [Darwinula stevensoni]CAG0891421.1 unnamed protein product [Darwinula stevensoni]